MNKKKHIDPEISLIYGIVNYGKVGMQVLNSDALLIFKDKPTQLENWLDAVAFCRMTYYTPIDPASGSGNFLNEIIKNPPFGGEEVSFVRQVYKCR